MKKYTQSEGSLEVLRGEEAQVLNDHLKRTGKAVNDFDDKERDALHTDLNKVRESSSEDNPAA